MCLWGRGSPPAHHSPSSFFSPPLLAATEPCSPPASPPLAYRTPCSTLDPALANRMGMSGLQWGDGGGRGGPCPCSSGFYLCRHNKRGRRENEKKSLSAAPASASASVSSSFSPPQSDLWAAPALSPCSTVSPLRGRKWGCTGGKDVYGSMQRDIK